MKNLPIKTYCFLIFTLLCFLQNNLFAQNNIFSPANADTVSDLSNLNRNFNDKNNEIESLNPKNNLTVIDSLVEIAMIELANKILQNKNFSNDTIYYKISENSSNWLISKHLNNKFQNKILINNKTNKNFIGITISELSVNYDLILDNFDSAKREINLTLFIEFLDKNMISTTFEIKKNSQDILDYDSLEACNSKGFDFANAAIPQRKLSFWNEYIQPTLAVVSAAIITTLFFTVRSK